MSIGMLFFRDGNKYLALLLRFTLLVHDKTHKKGPGDQQTGKEKQRQINNKQIKKFAVIASDENIEKSAKTIPTRRRGEEVGKEKTSAGVSNQTNRKSVQNPKSRSVGLRPDESSATAPAFDIHNSKSAFDLSLVTHQLH